MGVLPGAHSCIRTAAVVLWGLRGLLAAARRWVCVCPVVFLCRVLWCVQLCGAACVRCLAYVWCALLARACYGAGAGTNPLTGPFGCVAGVLVARLQRQCVAVGCVLGGGGSGSNFPVSPPPNVGGGSPLGLPYLPSLRRGSYPLACGLS